MTEEIMIVYGTDKGEYFYKPMGVKSITDAVKSELDKYSNNKYNIARMTIVKSLGKKNKSGYYPKDEIEFEIVDDSEFIKMYPGETKEGTKTFKDLKSGGTIDVKDRKPTGTEKESVSIEPSTKDAGE